MVYSYTSKESKDVKHKFVSKIAIINNIESKTALLRRIEGLAELFYGNDWAKWSLSGTATGEMKITHEHTEAMYGKYTPGL